jgi:hypothetical protein
MDGNADSYSQFHFFEIVVKLKIVETYRDMGPAFPLLLSGLEVDSVLILCPFESFVTPDHL